MEISIEVNRILCVENWEVIKPFAIELLQKENRCSTCGKPATPQVRIHGLNVREARVAVGLFHCPEHSSYYNIDNQLVNGLMILTKPDWKPVNKWFNVPYLDFQKIVYSRTQYGYIFPKIALRLEFIGVGKFYHKIVEIDKLPESYVIPQQKQDSTHKDNKETDLDDETYTFGNKFNHKFRVPVEVYSDTEYADRLDNATTLYEVEEIIKGFHGKHLKGEDRSAIPKEKEPKKKHWWQ